LPFAAALLDFHLLLLLLKENRNKREKGMKHSNFFIECCAMYTWSAGTGQKTDSGARLIESQMTNKSTDALKLPSTHFFVSN
jgi:hypothetical protein